MTAVATACRASDRTAATVEKVSEAVISEASGNVDSAAWDNG
jgi:hypothetical protein